MRRYPGNAEQRSTMVSRQHRFLAARSISLSRSMPMRSSSAALGAHSSQSPAGCVHVEAHVGLTCWRGHAGSALVVSGLNANLQLRHQRRSSYGYILVSSRKTLRREQTGCDVRRQEQSDVLRLRGQLSRCASRHRSGRRVGEDPAPPTSLTFRGVFVGVAGPAR